MFDPCGANKTFAIEKKVVNILHFVMERQKSEKNEIENGNDESENKPTNTTQPNKKKNKEIYTLKENSLTKFNFSLFTNISRRPLVLRAPNTRHSYICSDKSVPKTTTAKNIKSNK